MAKRIEIYFGNDVNQEDLINMSQQYISDKILSKVIDPEFLVGKGHWANRKIHHILLSLCRKRPRDLVKLMHGAARFAYASGHETISSSDLEQCFQTYSKERLQDIINEFRSELPEIEKVVLNMKPSRREKKASESFLFSNDSLSNKLRGIMSQSNISFRNGKAVNSRNLIEFLYKIDFITARLDKPDGQIERVYFDDNAFLASPLAEFGYNWEIHPAYRWALAPSDIQGVIDSLN